MDRGQRATVAFLCGCLYNKSGRRYTNVYDYSDRAFVACNYVNNGGSISVYDYRRGCYLTGSMPSFFDYGVSQYISINRVGDNMFNVYDYHSNKYVSVTCNGQSIALFDYSVGQYFSYSIN